MSSPQMHVLAAFMRLPLERSTPDPVAASKEPPRPPAEPVQRHDVDRAASTIPNATPSVRAGAGRSERLSIYTAAPTSAASGR
jgi:hypothetical protein